MTEPAQQLSIQSAVVSDRGLSEKRPINEDSYLADAGRRIFAVADGVGGAQAGEVASQTAIEVLDEAFRHNEDAVDIEDLMEIAIQRANSSIHRMAAEHPKFAMMATTVVVLHLDDRIATIGHVGDSRLYRLAPNGRLYRETADHSVVEEEVRAGRMTPDQALTHPSRNVISRALGVEETVEVDLKTIEAEEGTTFLLCSDGITRHLHDEELESLLATRQDPQVLCAEMKRRCYERGAEDNLTAVLVQIQDSNLDETTLVFERPLIERHLSDAGINAAQGLSQADTAPLVRPSMAAPSSEPYVAPPETQSMAHQPSARPEVVVAHSGRSLVSKIFLTFLFLVLLALVAAGAFYGGWLFRQQSVEREKAAAPTGSLPSPTPDDPALKLQQKRLLVDKDPAGWQKTEMTKEMTLQNLKVPLDSNDPEFLYLYGRARLLSGDSDGAIAALKKAIAKLNESGPGETHTPSSRRESHKGGRGAQTPKIQRDAVSNYRS